MWLAKPGANTGTAFRSIPGLDGLRAISIFLVIVTHARDTAGFPTAVPRALTDYSGLGVQIFFIISGFLITELLQSEKRAYGEIRLTSFYMRRVLRIVPAFLAFIVAMVTLRSLGLIYFNGLSLVGAATYSQNFISAPSWCLAHIWSLSVEEQFYLVWPTIIAFCSFKQATRCAAAVLLLGPTSLAGFYFLRLPFAVSASVRWFPFVADGMAIGALLAFFLPRIREDTRFKRAVQTRLGLLLLPLPFCIYSLRVHPRLFYPFGEWALLFIVAYFIARVTTSPVPVLQSKAFTFVGTLSYSLYLWQQPFLTPASTAWVCRFPQNLVCTVGVAAISHFLIERPALSFKKYFQRTQTARSVSDAAPLPAGIAAYK